MKPWASIVTVSVVYDDGSVRTLAGFNEDDEKDVTNCAHDALDKAATAYQTIHVKGAHTYRDLGRGRNYPVAVVIAYLDGALFGGRAPAGEFDSMDADFERIECDAEARVLRTFDVSGYYWMENFEQLLYAMAEAREEAENAA